MNATNVMKALTNSQVVAVYTAFEKGVTKAQLSRDYGVNVKSISKAIEIAEDLRAKAKARIESANKFIAKVEEKVMARPTKKVTVVAAKQSIKQRVKNMDKRPINSMMADAFKKAGM